MSVVRCAFAFCVKAADLALNGRFGNQGRATPAPPRALQDARKECIKSALNYRLEVSVSVRFNVVLSEELNREIDKAAEETESNKSEILRKALQLYLAARDGKRRGLKLGLIEPKSEKLQTEIVGL